MSDFSTNLQLPYLMPAQAQKHVTVNESLRRMDALVQMRVQSRTTTEQPSAPLDGELWITPAGKSGTDWDLFGDGAIAFYRDGAWEQISPRPGWFAFVIDEDELAVYGATGWRSVGIDGDQDVFVTLSADSGDPVAATSTVDAFTLAGGPGLTTVGDGALKTVTVSLAETGVTAGGYGGADKALGVTVDAQGRITALTQHDLGALAAKDAVAGGDIQDGAVTLAKIQNIETGRVLARQSAGAGPAETLTAAQMRTLLNVEDGATGDMSGAAIKAAYETEADTNAYTDSEKAKLAAIDAAHYGAPLQSLAELAALAEADIADKERRYVEDALSDYFYDGAAASGDVAPDDQTGGTGFWRKVSVGGESPASIKTKYESNADTNGYTDAEQAKLAGVEAGATGDMTGSEIKSAYEDEADTNAFTDAEKAKLAGVETGATGDMTGGEIKSAYEGEADTNAFTDAEKAKLAGMEAGATADPSDAEIEAAYNNQVAVVGQAEAEAGTATDVRRWTAERVAQAIAAQAATGGGGGALGVRLFNSDESVLPDGGVQATHHAVAANVYTKLYAAIPDAEGAPGDEITLNTYVNGVKADGPRSVVRGAPVSLSGLSIDVGAGDTAHFEIEVAGGAPFGFVAQIW